ncbi:MAG: hypothetical protein JW939_00620 [Candidatus Thermoplasmatota archaeon]|nr:hypothetical protein [Candidatus Thermoplasmatota archaeon]
MKGLRLSDRVNGSEFCQFERALIFNPDLKDTGFVSHLGARTFRLLKSKFTNIDSGRIYILPEDGSISLTEGCFVRVEVDRTYRDIRLDLQTDHSGLVGDTILHAEVGAVKEERVPLPPPVLPADEFLHRVSRPWKDPEEDHLDHIIALLMLSSPRSIMGRGGLGSEGIQRERGLLKGSNRDLANTILSQLPVEFRTGGASQYKYSKIESLNDIRLVQSGRVSENCYSLVPDRIYESMVERRIPIQLPFVVRNAEFRGLEPEIDLDVLDYQLSGLYLPPPPEKLQEEIYREIMVKLSREEFWDIRTVGEIDRTAGPRIGLALSRLFIGRRFDGRAYRASRTDPSEAIDIIRRILGYGFENMRLKLKEEDYLRSRRSEPWRDKLRPLDKEIFIQLRTMSEEQGTDEIPRDAIMPGIGTHRVDESLERLNRYGYVLHLKGGSLIKLVVPIEHEDIQ